MSSVTSLLYEVTILREGHARVLARPLTRRHLELAAELGVHFLSIVPVEVVDVPDSLTGEALRRVSEIRESVEKLCLPAIDRLRVMRTIRGIHERVFGGAP